MRLDHALAGRESTGACGTDGVAVRLGEECGDGGGGGVVGNPGGWADLNEVTGDEDREAIGERGGLGRVVGDE